MYAHEHRLFNYSPAAPPSDLLRQTPNPEEHAWPSQPRGPVPNSTHPSGLACEERTPRLPCAMQVTTKSSAAAGAGAESVRLENAMPVLPLMVRVRARCG